MPENVFPGNYQGGFTLNKGCRIGKNAEEVNKEDRKGFQKIFLPSVQQHCAVQHCGCSVPYSFPGIPRGVMVAGAPCAVSMRVCGVCGCLRSWDFFPFLPQRGCGVREAPICRLPSEQHCCQGLYRCFKTSVLLLPACMAARCWPLHPTKG